MLLSVYQVLWRMAPKIIQRYLRKRARMAPAYLAHWDERFGKPLPNPVRQPIWIHAVSVGETRAAAPLIAALQQYFPDAPLLLTQMTPTGRETAEQLYPHAQCRYLPYDRKDYVAQFLQEHQPIMGILMETELWPNLMHACHHSQIPLFLANARLSEKSLQGYLKAASLFQPAVSQLTAIFAQTQVDAERLKSLGASTVEVCGNSKYDIEPPQAAIDLGVEFKQKIGSRLVLVCGSTRVDKQGVDEAQLLLQAWAQQPTDALLVIVPRHPERFEAVFEAAKALGLKAQKRSDGHIVRPETQVWIGDSMGELFAYYQCADVVFVGGSLVDTGCQNVIEPIACGKPTVFGFSTYNFTQACSAALEAGVAIQVQTASQWLDVVTHLLQDDSNRLEMQQQAQQFIRHHQGASDGMAQRIAAQVKGLNRG
ncbi:3-deoxy-D-manno-octulosonic acid transferase [Vitreoscilla sp. C1]|uniref:lipid IV(A) 3-deoxy-D-manno-octulosonic acid transferase n=1 Tax=Vitreoscilla sp. (strain C1) TaxID=96942 RepID=UPI000CDC93DD|nr:lipid IV(A) 3-deoxy-D-manno-octulosonic acid transferase [Vitreoscilla sp. C1]AUZ06299.1 3-deoxy-D-manno-octulosonic acid transferase [Vitreoscilla sp. C1]